MSEKEKDQGKIIMYQVLQAELEELKRQTLLIENRLLDIETTEHALNEMVKFKKDNETLVPLGSGCYAHGNILGSGVLLDIGAGLMVTKSVNSDKSFLEYRKEEIEEDRKKIQVQMYEVVKNINKLTPEIEKIVRESQKR
ncbi:MAG: prefoldin subunit alpha [Candidatus Aenigmatarchaeota archaeon]|nr:MAG: prefoldin subunit alpha [Candidatus Aenigmarchaeota archaeon]